MLLVPTSRFTAISVRLMELDPLDVHLVELLLEVAEIRLAPQLLPDAVVAGERSVAGLLPEVLQLGLVASRQL